MAEYLAPGVYVEEIPLGVHPIEGVSTSTAGFVGPCRYGSVLGPAAFVTGLAEFERAFGASAPLGFATAGSPAPTSVTLNYMWNAVRAFFAEGGKRLYIARAFRPLTGEYPPTGTATNLGGAGAPLWSDGHARYVDGTLNIRARFPGSAGNLIVRLTLAARVPGSTTIDPTLTIEVVPADAASALRRWGSLSLDSDPSLVSGAQSVFNCFADVLSDDDPVRWPPVIFDTPADGGVTASDRAANWFSLNPAAIPPDSDVTQEIQLAGGNDGLLPRAAEYARSVDTNSDSRTGLMQFEEIDDISIVAAPGATARHGEDPVDAASITELLIAHAERMRYRIAVLDTPPGMSVGDVRAWRGARDSSRAALYYPWITIKDPDTGSELNLPPSGFVAGIYARNDMERGVNSAPANEVVTLAVNFERSIDQAEQELLNPVGINCLRFFPGRGYRVWGARTLASDPQWKYVNLRRLFIYLEQAIDRGTQWVVFEPNNEALWTAVRQSVGSFLYGMWRDGALQGTSSKDAFFVKCDRETMTQDDIDSGRLVCDIGIAPLKPAEFVVFRIGQWTADHKDS
ncbi:MAG: phage tail sheath subtilisin-like domain-containing protein [Betaproteobacteria bacterium]